MRDLKLVIIHNIVGKNQIKTMSETATSRAIFEPFIKGLGLDCGFGGDSVHPSAITMDLPQVEGGRYTTVGADKQILQGHCGDLSGFTNESLDYIHSSHLLEDFSYSRLVEIIAEWRRVLKVGGLILTNCPNQKSFLAHCAKTSQPLNLAHHEATFSLETFKSKVLAHTGPWETVLEVPEHGPYSWLQIIRKI